MKTLSTKVSKCTSIKILVEKNEDRYEIVSDMKRRGFHTTTKPNFYTGFTDTVVKHSSEGVVITFVKYESLDRESK